MIKNAFSSGPIGAEFEKMHQGLKTKFKHRALAAGIGLPVAGTVIGAATAKPNASSAEVQDRAATGMVGGALASIPAMMLLTRGHRASFRKLYKEYEPKMREEWDKTQEEHANNFKQEWDKSWEDFSKQWQNRWSGGAGGRYSGTGGGTGGNAGGNAGRAHGFSPKSPHYDTATENLRKAKTKAEAKSIYRKMAMESHPDKTKHTGRDTSEQFKHTNNAWNDFQQSDEFNKMSSLNKIALMAMMEEMSKYGF